MKYKGEFEQTKYKRQLLMQLQEHFMPEAKG